MMAERRAGSIGIEPDCARAGDLAQGRCVGDRDRCAEGHRFERRQAEPFDERRHDEQARVRDDRRGPRRSPARSR